MKHISKKYVYYTEILVNAWDGCTVYVNGSDLNVQECYKYQDIKCDLRHVGRYFALVEYGSAFYESLETIPLSCIFVIINNEKYYIKRKSIWNKIMNKIYKHIVPVSEAYRNDENVKNIVDKIQSGDMYISTPGYTHIEWTDNEKRELDEALEEILKYTTNDK